MNCSEKKHWLIYALGGGWGHINRALSLANAVNGNRQVTILANSPYLEYISSKNCQIEPIKKNSLWLVNKLKKLPKTINTIA